jgi:transposase, IS6 family
MTSSSPFKWRHFQPEIILCGVRWYLRYSLSYRDVEELILERGLHVDHTTVFRWVQCYAPELNKRSRPHLQTTNDSYRVDEKYIKIKKVWHYLYRAVDSEGNTLDFLLSETRDAKAAQKFFRKVLGAHHTVIPRVITVDQNAAYPPAVQDLTQAELLPQGCELRQSKYVNNMIEQDHRFVKRRVNPGLGFGSFDTAERTLQGYEVMNMIRKGQLRDARKGAVLSQNAVIAELFGVAA